MRYSKRLLLNECCFYFKLSVPHVNCVNVLYHTDGRLVFLIYCMVTEVRNRRPNRRPNRQENAFFLLNKLCRPTTRAYITHTQ